MDLRACISPIGFGAFKIGRNEGIKYAQGYEIPDDQSVERLLNGVLDLGVTYIDTAPAYGLSEERIGRFLSHRRKEFVLSTKAGERFEDGTSVYDFSSRAIQTSIEQSLRRLRTDVVDIFFLHAPRADLNTLTQTEGVDALVAAREKGWARTIGFSGYTAEAFRAAMAWADVIMVEYHPENRALEPIITEAAARGVLIVVKKPLGSGRIPPRQAIEFSLSNPAVSSLVIGSMNLEHMAQNVRLAAAIREPGDAIP